MYGLRNWQNCAAFNRGILTIWRYQQLSRTNSVQDNRKHRISVNTFFELQQILRMFYTRLYVLARRLYKTRDSFLLKIFPRFLQWDFWFRNCIGFGWSFQKFLASLSRHDTCRKFKLGGGHCFFWIIYRQFAFRYCWTTRAVCMHLAGRSRLHSSINIGSIN